MAWWFCDTLRLSPKLFLYSSRSSGIWWNQTKLKSGISAALRGAISPASEGQAIGEPTQPKCGTDGTHVAIFFWWRWGIWMASHKMNIVVGMSLIAWHDHVIQLLAHLQDQIQKLRKGVSPWSRQAFIRVRNSITDEIKKWSVIAY